MQTSRSNLPFILAGKSCIDHAKRRLEDSGDEQSKRLRQADDGIHTLYSTCPFFILEWMEVC